MAAQWLWKLYRCGAGMGLNRRSRRLFAYLHPLHISPKLATKDSQRFSLRSVRFSQFHCGSLKVFLAYVVVSFHCFFLCQFLFTAIIVALSSLPRMKSAPYYVPLIRSDIPTFILRATRDEASLTIGFAQSINALLRRVYGAFDEPLWTTLPTGSVS